MKMPGMEATGKQMPRYETGDRNRSNNRLWSPKDFVLTGQQNFGNFNTKLLQNLTLFALSLKKAVNRISCRHLGSIVLVRIFVSYSFSCFTDLRVENITPIPKTIGNGKKILCVRLCSGDKHHLRKSSNRKAQIRKAFGPLTGLHDFWFSI